MRISLILITVLFLQTTLSRGQNSGFLTGYVVNKSNDTIQGFVKYINQVPYRVLPDIKFKENNDSKAKEYTPADLIAYKAGDKIFHSMIVPGNVYSRQSFMELVVSGQLKLYECRVTSMGVPQYGSGTSSSYYLLKGETKLLFDIEKGKFKDTVSEYLSDVKEVSDKVKLGDFKKRDIENIVKEYNRIKGQ